MGRFDEDWIRNSFRKHGIERTEDLIKESENSPRKIEELLKLYKEIILKALWEVR